MRAHIHIRIDAEHPLLHDINLVFTDCRACRDDLPVEIGQTDLVIIDQVKCPDTAAHKCFTHISADTSDAEYCDSGLRELLHRLRPEQQLCSRKLI